MVVIPALGKWKLKDQETKAIHDYTASSNPAWAKWNPVSNNQNKTKIKQPTCPDTSIDIWLNIELTRYRCCVFSSEVNLVQKRIQKEQNTEITKGKNCIIKSFPLGLSLLLHRYHSHFFWANSSKLMWLGLSPATVHFCRDLNNPCMGSGVKGH